ncbi:MAG: BPL-N domain-containing protein [Planctomycetes bacterium]|nr:BPL-N domain-containing protein [Planctomycetota bacterium]
MKMVCPKVNAIAVAWLVAIMSPLLHPARGEEAAGRQPIRIAIYADSGAGEKAPNLSRCLSPASKFVYQLVTAKEIRDGALDRFDVVIHPGGSGQKQANALGVDGRRAVCGFVERGGGYVGICAGAYLASDHFVWSLGLLDARFVDRKHWARGTGEVQLRLSELGRKALGVDRETLAIYYGQGPLLAPDHNDDIPDYELLATYETEIAENGAPAGVMKGTAAIARGIYGRGRVFCFSPHPEKTAGLETLVHAAVRWAAGARNADQ